MGGDAVNYSEHCERLSHSEHQARAMLLGLAYDWRDGIYSTLVFWGDDAFPTTEGALDCLTCEPIDGDEYSKRIAQGYTNNLNSWRNPTQPTPWAKLG